MIIGDHIFERRVKQFVCNRWASRSLIKSPLHGAANEVLLTADTTKITRSVFDPIIFCSVKVGVTRSRSYVCECVIARKLKATRCRHIQTSFFVASLVQKRNADSAYRIDDFLKGTKVDVDVVIDTDSKVLVNRVDELVWVFAIKSSVDAVGASRTSNFDPQVTRKRQKCRAVVFWINANNHDRVAALAKACSIAKCSCIRRIWVDTTAVV